MGVKDAESHLLRLPTSFCFLKMVPEISEEHLENDWSGPVVKNYLL